MAGEKVVGVLGAFFICMRMDLGKAVEGNGGICVN